MSRRFIIEMSIWRNAWIYHASYAGLYGLQLARKGDDVQTKQDLMIVQWNFKDPKLGLVPYVWPYVVRISSHIALKYRP